MWGGGLRNLKILPKVRDSWTYLYVEHARIDQEMRGICIHDSRGRTYVPCASLSLLMLGPGTSLTHAAVHSMAEAGCLVAWVGEQGIRFYAEGMGETRSSANLLRQASLWADPGKRMRVVRKMYEMRFDEPIPPELTLRQIRGKEGARVRAAYANVSKKFGVEWRGRRYNRQHWDATDPVNRALSAANACLYGVCHAAIVALGYSPAIGFIHTGKMLSFVYDIADLYKLEVAVPAAFEEASHGADDVETRVRHKCRDHFYEHRLLKRIARDVQALFGASPPQEAEALDMDMALPGELWDPEGNVGGGHNFGGDMG